MKVKTQIRLPLVISIVLVSMVSMVGCTAPATQPPATPVPPTQPSVQATPMPQSNSEIVPAMVERLSAGDAEGSLAYFADNALGYVVGLPPTGMEIYRGKEEIRLLWEDSVSNHFQWEVEITRANGDMVYVQAKTWHDFTRELGVAPLEWNDVYEVKDGKITTYSTVITKDALARLKPALAEVMPPEPTAAPPSDPPASEMTVTIAGGTCTADSPPILQAGEVTVTLDVQDQDKSLYALMLLTWTRGRTFWISWQPQSKFNLPGHTIYCLRLLANDGKVTISRPREKGYTRSDCEHPSDLGCQYTAELLSQMGYELVPLSVNS